METDDPRIRKEYLHGQEVLLPNLQAWSDIVHDGHLDGLPLPLPDYIARWLVEYGGIEEACLGLWLLRSHWTVQQFLRLAGRYYPVHFENVICEHCGRRCGPSACPDTLAFARTGYTAAEAWAEFDALPLQNCPHCGGILRRRQTVWLASKGRE